VTTRIPRVKRLSSACALAPCLSLSLSFSLSYPFSRPRPNGRLLENRLTTAPHYAAILNATPSISNVNPHHSRWHECHCAETAHRLHHCSSDSRSNVTRMSCSICARFHWRSYEICCNSSCIYHAVLITLKYKGNKKKHHTRKSFLYKSRS